METKRYFRKFTDNIETGYLLIGAASVLALLAVTQMPQLQQPQGNATITVDITVDYGDEVDKYSPEVLNGSTVFSALNKSAEVDIKEYSFGYFVTSINGVTQNSTHSWMYFVNSESPSKAVNNYVLGEYDSVKFRFMSNNESAELVE